MAAPSKKSTKRHPKDGLKPHKTAMKSQKRKNNNTATRNDHEAKNKTKYGLNAVEPEILQMQLEDEDPDFPRGGGSVLSKQEAAEARAEAEADFEAEEMQLKKGKKRQKRPSFATEDDIGSLFGGGITGKLPKYANKITMKNISKGMKLWGVIVEVNQKDIVVGLPGGLRGFVRAEDASDVFSDIGIKDSESKLLHSFFHVGQLVSCIVLQVDDDKRENKGNKRIWLSLQLSLLYKGFTLDAVQDGMVLTAYVKSIEDHGYILHFGLSSFSGFLPLKNGEDIGKVNIHVGEMVQGVVKSVDKARGVIYMSNDPDLVSKSVIKDLKGLSIDLLIPGMMVTALVQATLENGIMLSFLTYFTGTVDIFHLLNPFPSGTWKDEYSRNKKVAARIIFVDPSSRAVGLTMNPHLHRNKAPPLVVTNGDIFETSRVVRVDRGFGLLLELPSEPVPTPSYVSIHDASDDEVRKLEKKFREGSRVRSRVLGFKYLEGVAVGTLKASAFEGSVFTHADVKPGMRVKGKVVSVDEKGALVQLSSGVKALCPVSHMSEYAFPRRSSKFKVGVQLLFRVLGCKSKRITVTYKKSLVRSNLGMLASYADAAEGYITHGWIEKIENYGCFVRFYNGVKGFAHRTELGLDPASEAQSTFHEGEVVKCRVISASPASRKISLSFVISPKRISQDDDVPKLGSLVSGVILRLEPLGVIVQLKTKNYIKGTIFSEHLADFQGHADQFKSLLKPGYEFDQLLVLDYVRDNLILSAKYSLINSAEQLPQEIGQVHPHSIVHGYICNCIETGYFVRYLGCLTGFAPKNKTTDDQTVGVSEAFYIGQSVRSHILDVDREKGRIKLSLKQSSCFSTDASFICGYFLLEEKVAELNISNSDARDFKWVGKFNIGSLVEVEVLENREFGVLVGLKDCSDVVGFITNYHLGETKVEVGSVAQALVLDMSKADSLVDLSLKPDLVNCNTVEGKGVLPSKKKRKREGGSELKLHETVNAVVEMVKETYLVLSLPDYGQAIGFASIYDYNTQKLSHKNYVSGQRVLATIEALPGPSTVGRLLLLLKSLSEVVNGSSSKRAKKKSTYHIGLLVQAEITEIRLLELRVKFGIGIQGRVHITEVADDERFVEKPFSNFKIGQLLTARIVANDLDLGKSNSGSLWELSVKPSLLAETGTANSNLMDRSSFSVGDAISGYVVKVDSEWVWLAVSRKLRAQIFILDSSKEPSELQAFQNRFAIGQVASGSIISINEEKKLLRLTLCSSHIQHDASIDGTTTVGGSETATPSIITTHHIYQGDVIGGRISKVLPGVGGLLVQIGPHLYGKVHFTEIADMWVSDPLNGYEEGQFVKCVVLEIGHSFKGTVHVDLSLRISLTRLPTAKSAASDKLHSDSKRYENMEELHPKMEVQGYVKSVTPKGCFIMLSRKIDAKILLSNLSDGYVENPEREFHVGKLVMGRIFSLEPSSQRVEVTLKTKTVSRDRKCQMSDLCKLHAGDVISGTIKQLQPYGLFITIDQTSVVGLCHISELSDSHIDNIVDKYRAGERVVAKILKIDEERLRVSLGMKNSYVQNDSGLPVSNVNDTTDNNRTVGEIQYDEQLNGNLTRASDAFPESTNGCFQVFELAEARASVPPLDVTLNDLEGSDTETAVTSAQESKANGTDSDIEKRRRRQKRKEKEEREMEIRTAEERLLQKDVPRTADEFEKLVRGSPNSSFAWIKYMAYWIDLADVEKARCIAERALRTINFREEAEKLNIWVAYFNLENKFGNPPQEAVMKIFQRALQYCDPKKVHLALLDMYEKSEQQQLSNELLDKMTKKFKKSCKVWLRRVHSLLLQRQEVQSVVNRALLSLVRNKHIKFISHTAILEFKCGIPERGRSMFEGVLREYPKRIDLWSVYLDQEIRLGDAEIIRSLFERAICLTLAPRRMKFIFKKYHDYEKSCGDKDRMEYVKKKAMEFLGGV